ncbi:MAG: hypothetical protein R2747_15670 [Pyrinomonadaceae bacterium]
MSKENKEILQIKNYLLGSNPDDSEKIEERLMTDDGFFEQILAFEEEIIQDYVDGRLTENEKERFETHFLISEERRQKLSFARAFRRQIDRLSPPSKPPADPESFFPKSLSGFIRKFRPALAIAAVLIVIIGGFLYFQMSADKPASSLEIEFARLNRGDLGNPAQYADLTPLGLAPGSTRGADGPENLTTRNLTDKIFVRLALPIEVQSGEVFRIVLSSNQTVIFTQNEIKAYQNPNGQELRLLIPGSVLAPGNYQIRAKGGKSEEFSYYFSVK